MSTSYKQNGEDDRGKPRGGRAHAGADRRRREGGGQTRTGRLAPGPAGGRGMGQLAVRLMECGGLSNCKIAKNAVRKVKALFTYSFIGQSCSCGSVSE